jgi:Holliday junction resolvasome RuvABC ATP-dependent DNA helicase subunit
MSDNTIPSPSITPTVSDRLSAIVGQDNAKRKINHLIDCYYVSHYFPPSIFTAPKGQGKTTLAIETSRHLCLFDELGRPMLNSVTNNPRPKPLIKINCAAIKNFDNFVSSIFIRHINDKDVTVLFDEASEIPHTVTMAMLDLFNTTGPDVGYRSRYEQAEHVLDIDFRRQSFIFCTSEPQKVFHALMSRLERISLADYTKKQLAAIIEKGMQGILIDDNVMEEAATVVRGNARDAAKLAINLHNFLQGNEFLLTEDWNKFKEIWGIKPLGLTDQEIEALRYIGEHPDGVTLTRLASKTGLTRTALQRDVELMLLKHDLINIEESGRVISAKGTKYLKRMDNPADNQQEVVLV